MKKLFKWIGILLVLLLVLIIGAAVILPLMIDPNDHKDRIVQVVESQTGRDFSIGGEIEWSVFPSIGLGLSDLTLGNADGFGAPHMAKVQSATVSVKLRPLLSRQVEVDGIALSGLDLNLETAASGANNWEGLSSGTTESSDSGGAIDRLQVGFIELVDSRVNWIKPGQTVSVDEIAITTGAITTTDPIDIDYSLKLKSEDLKLDATLAGEADVRNALADAPIVATVSGLSLKGSADAIRFELNGDNIVADLGAELIELAEIKISGESGDLPFAGEIAGGSFNLASDTADLPSISVNSGPLRLNLSGQATNVSEQMVVTGKLTLSELDPKALLRHLGQEVPQTADSSVLSALSLSTDFSYGADRASLKNLAARLDQTNLRGDVDVSSIERLAATFNLDIDQLDLDGYLPPASEETSGSASGQGLDANLGNLNGRVKLGRATFAKAELTNLDLTIRTTPQGLTIKETASLYEGQSSGGLELNAATGRLKFNNQVSGVQASPLLKALTDSELLSGVGQLNVDVDVGNAFADNPLSTLNGTVSFEFNDGAIMGFNVFSMLRQASAKLGLDSDASAAEFEQTDFSRFVFSANVVDGVLQTKGFDLRSPFLRAVGSGSINLADMSLDYTLKPTLVKSPEGQGGVGLDQLEGVELPLGIGGTVYEPKLRLDPQALLMAWQGERIEAEKEKLQSRLDEEKDKLADRLGSKLFGNRSEPETETETGEGEATDPAAEPAEEESTEDKLKGRLRGLFGKDDDDDGGR